jgi:hypothetical protein
MPDDDSTSEEPQAQPAEPVPASEPEPEPLWDVTKLETRSRDPEERDSIYR